MASPHIAFLANALQRIRSTPPRLIASPPSQPRRASVSLILHLTPPAHLLHTIPVLTPQPSLPEFFAQDWVRHPDTRADLLFIRREAGDRDTGTSVSNGNVKGKQPHIAFPGGRTEDGDESSLYTAMRQTWEEIGIDLAENEWTCVGQLDDREITTSLGKRLLMVLSPFVFLHLSPHPPVFDTQATDPNVPVPILHWIPLTTLTSSHPTWSHVTIDISSRLAPRHSTLRLLAQILVGNMRFRALVLRTKRVDWGNQCDHQDSTNGYGLEKRYSPSFDSEHTCPEDTAIEDEVRLWGLTLGMTLDLITYMQPSLFNKPLLDPMYEYEESTMGPALMTPSMKSIFPRFVHFDVNFWIWVFGKRYRDVIRGWEESNRGSNDRRINWSGQALSTFYAAVRKALIVVILGRALGVLAALIGMSWWIWKKWLPAFF